MSSKKKTKNADLEQRWTAKMRQEKEAQAENRRKLLASLNPKTREFAQREFAKLGLFQ
jgi:hypothetical protein